MCRGALARNYRDEDSGSGIEAMSAIAVRSDGTSLGICGQSFWARKRGPSIKHTRRKRSLKDKETKHWLEVIKQVELIFSKEAPGCKPWFQLDRGGDFKELLIFSASTKSYVTVRCTQDRVIIDSESRLLWEKLKKQKPIGKYSLDISAGPNRKARRAKMQVRSSEILFFLYDEEQKKKIPVKLNAILVREEGTIPANEKGIEWLLITNYAVNNFDDACLVIFGYSQRWRIEEFHKAWKSVCGVEKIQLERYDNIIKLATMLAAVAMRVERLKFLSRNSPALPASVELTQKEIDALIILQKPKGYELGQMPTIAEAVRWIADLGAYTGKSSGGPPGNIVLGRGLRELQMAVRAFEALEQMKAGAIPEYRRE
jgi:hypothetical protein